MTLTTDKKRGELQVRKGADAEVLRIERFQSLQAGQYWRAKQEIADEDIEDGWVLLIQSIRWAEDKPHTIILRAHPSVHGKRHDTHRFLLNDFLRLFEFEPDPSRIRNKEIEAVQGRIQLLQKQLSQANSNEQEFTAMIAVQPAGEEGAGGSGTRRRRRDVEHLPEDPAAANLPADATQDFQAAQMATGTVSDAVEAGLSEESIARMRAVARQQHEIATRKAQWISKRTEEISVAINALTPYYSEQAAAALARTEDLRAYVSKLLDGIQSLDLYVGKGVHVTPIVKGASADPSEPLTFVQRKLAMDEELALWADVEESFDFESQEVFFEKLAETPDLRDQIFPAPRAVILMYVTQRHFDYGEPVTSYLLNKENKKVFLLVRDGENVYRVDSPVESHLGADMLFPSMNHLNQIFRGFDGTNIKFEDVAYTDHLDRFDREALHYKRFLLLCCGLDHRERLFGEFYPGQPSMEFMSMRFQEERCRFNWDASGSGVPLGREVQPLSEYIREHNAKLASGSRVLCYWPDLFNPDTAPGCCRTYRQGDGFEIQYSPQSQWDVLTVQRAGNDLYVEVQVTGDDSKYRERSFKARVSLSKFRIHQWRSSGAFAYLCLDRIEPEHIRTYLQRREERAGHLAYVRLFKRVLKVVEADRDAEKTARDFLIAHLEHLGKQGKAAVSLAIQCIVAWRTSRRGAEVPEPPVRGRVPGAKFASLVDLATIAHALEGKVPEEIRTQVKAEGRELLRITLRGDGVVQVFVSPTGQERDDRLCAHRFVRQLRADPYRQWSLSEPRWAALGGVPNPEILRYEGPGSDAWQMAPDSFASPEHKAEVFCLIEEWRQRLARWGSFSGAQWEEEFQRWKSVREVVNRKSRLVENPELYIPLGVVNDPERRRVKLLCLAHVAPHALLAKKASLYDRDRVKSQFASMYRDKSYATTMFEKAIARESQWQLELHPLPKPGAGFVELTSADGSRSLSYDGVDPRVSIRLASFLRGPGKLEVFLPQNLRADMGALDPLCETPLPTDYEPQHVVEVTLDSPMLTFFDIFPMKEEEFGRGIQVDGYHSTWNAEIDKRVAVPQKNAHSSISSSYYSAATLLRAREKVRHLVGSEKPSKELRLSTEVPGAPQPHPGVERWVMVELGNKAS